MKTSPRRRLFLHATLIVGSVVMLYPLLWMLSSSLKGEGDIFGDPSLWPDEATLSNFINGWTALGTPFGRFFVNSFVLCALAVIGNILSCTLAAFAFARLRFPLRGPLFALMITTIMLPMHATIVPQYIMFKTLGWIGTFAPIVAPKFLAVDAFFVFLIIQFIRALPLELDDSAKLDGCSTYTLFLRIVLPLTLPALATTAIFTFIWTWNDFFSQLLYLGGSTRSYTVQVALSAFVDSTSQSSWGQLMAMSVLSILPILGFFLAFQRLLVEGISTTGLKG